MEILRSDFSLTPHAMRQILANRFLLLAVFLLPWQTRWIFSVPTINSDPSEYGQLSLYATEVLVLVVLLLRGRPIVRPELKWVMQGGYFLLASAFFSLAFSSVFGVGLAQIFHMLVAFTFLTILIDSRTRVTDIAITFVSGLLIPSLIGWWQVLTGSSPESSWLGLAIKDAANAGTAVVETASGRTLRAYGTLTHPNVFGGFLAVGLVVMAWLAKQIKSRRTLWLSALPVVLLSSTFIITFSRGAWLGLGIGFLSLIGLMLYRRRIAPSRALPIILLGLVSMLATMGVFYQQTFSRLRATGRVEAISVEERSSQYSWFDDVLMKNPVLGVGPGAYTFALSGIDPGSRVWDYQPIHNTFLLVLGELGALGLFALVYLLVRVDQVSSRTAKTAGGMLALTLGITLFVIALFDHYLFSQWPGLALSVFGLSFAMQWGQALES